MSSSATVESENWISLENGERKLSSSSLLLRKRSSDPAVNVVVSRFDRFRIIIEFLVNFRQVVLGTKLCVLIPAIPLAILAQYHHFSRVSSVVRLIKPPILFLI